jgi:hypothetical protein
MMSWQVKDDVIDDRIRDRIAPGAAIRRGHEESAPARDGPPGRPSGRRPPLIVTYQSDIILIGGRSGRTPQPQEHPMNAHNQGGRGWRDVIYDYTPMANSSKGLRGWWMSPPRRGIYRLISPWEYRHLRFYGSARIAGGCVAAAAGLICLSYSAYGWAAFFLVIAALNLAGGGWFVTIANSEPARA